MSLFESSGSRTLKSKLRAMILITSAVALVAASGAFLTYDYFSFRLNMENRLQVLTEVVATQAGPALAFNDARVASEILGTLAAAPQIVSAAIYSRNGALLTRYVRTDAPADTVPSAPGADGPQADRGHIAVFRPMITDGDRLGTIYLRSDLEEASQRLRLNSIIVGAILIVVLLISTVFSARVVRGITGPLAGLVEVVNAVTTRRDYSLRAPRQGPDELAVLIDGINDMFSQIQVRDGALQLARNELENRVQERTAELTFVNQELSAEVSERRRIESSLRESEERYRQLVEFSPDAIMIHRDGKFLFVNGAALRLFEAKSAEDLIGTQVLDRVALEFRDIVRERIRQVDVERRATAPLEQRLVRLDGAPIDAEAQETPFIFQGRTAVQVVIRDISKRKEIERMKDEFVSTVSHELRTPLTSIQGSLGLIANGVTGVLPPAAKPLVDIAYKNCSRLVLLINDILDSEKIAAGKMKFAMKEQDLMPLLEQVIESTRAYGAQYGIRYEIGERVPGARVEVDADRMIQVLTNLLSNAAKFSPRGGVVTVSVRRVDGKLRVGVIDRGAGIPPEFQDRIFQKFSQADSSDRRAKGGTGLGLSISKAIVEKHGGALSFVTEVGKGTTFFVDLPDRSSVPPPSPTAPSSAPVAVICDDEPQVAEILRTILLREGFQPAVAQTLQECRELLARKPAALLTLDFMLPDGNGVELIRELRASARTKSLPILLISPLSASAMQMAGEGLGPLEFLDKPIEIARLASAAKTALAAVQPQTEGASP